MRKETEKVYETLFINKRDVISMVDFDRGQSVQLRPGEEWSIKTTDASLLWSPFEKVQFLKSGEVKTTERKGFEPPVKKDAYGCSYVLKIINVDGSPSESFQVDTDKRISVLKGVPRYVHIDLANNLVKFKELRIQMQKVREPLKVAGYFQDNWKLGKILIERDKKEIDQINVERKKNNLPLLTKEQKGKIELEEMPRPPEVKEDDGKGAVYNEATRTWRDKSTFKPRVVMKVGR